MVKKKQIITIAVWVCIFAALIAGIIMTGSQGGKHETIKETMRDAVLHETNHISLWGHQVNPAVISALIVTASLLIIATLIRLFAIPKFRLIPGRFQLLLEQMVGFFDGTAKANSPHRNHFLGAYIFGAGVYIFFSTVFELFGLQAITTAGHSISLPAPLSDINAAIALGCMSYLVILMGGLFGNGLRGVGSALKDFSLPISMSFRLFGALLSGLLVTELVYYYIQLSFVLPIIIGIVFTLLHACIQTYVLVMLTALNYGEASLPHKKEKETIGLSLEGGYQHE
jgi:F-type H+-transporting ATPase subunit a